MKSLNFTALVLTPVTLLCLAGNVNAQLVDLGAAGNYAVLETGNGNVSLAAAPPHGFINGNVGAAGGNLSDSGVGISGNTYLGSGATSSGLSGNVSGTIYTGSNLNAAIAAAAAAANAAAALSSSGGGSSYGVGSSINASGGTLNLTPGVYNLVNFTLGNNEVVNLGAGGSYVFNISGTMSLNSARILAAVGLSAANVLFNIESSQAVGFSGGLNNECELDGVLLAENAQVHLTPGFVNGEIISGQSINIASGGSVTASTRAPVPEPAQSGLTVALFMLGLMGISSVAKLRFRNRKA
jgi:hypothetical protein